MYKKLIRTVATTLLLLTLSGCGTQKETETFHVGTNVWPGYEPLHLAYSENYYTEPIQVTSYKSATDVLTHFRKGHIQAAAVTLDETILLKDQGYSPLVVAVLDISDGADVILAKPDIESLQELKGRTIGVENSALGSYVLARALQIGGLSYDDVDILPISVDEHEAAFKQDVVDAVITFEPVRSVLLKNGANEIFSSKEIPNEIVDVLIVQKELADSRSAADLLNGWGKAAKELIDREPKAVETVAKRLDQTPSDFILSLEGLKIPTRKESDAMFGTRTLEKTIDKIQKVMYSRQLIQKPLDPRSILPE